MKCPYCNEEMVKGYIQCRDGVDWTEKNKSLQLCLHWEKEEHLLQMGLLKIIVLYMLTNVKSVKK